MGNFIQQLGSLRSPVSTYANLPITGNVLGDLRILTDLGVLYTWMSSSGSGSLSDWKKVTVSSYNDLVGRPGSTPLAIDDATLSIRNIYMNYILLLFKTMITASVKVYKMFDGMFDNFFSDETMDSVHSSNFKYFPSSRYMPNLGGFDEYTKYLIQGAEPYVAGHDLCDNVILGQWTGADTVITKFHPNCWKFRGPGYPNDYLSSNNSFENVDGLDFTWDLWIRFQNISGLRQILVQHKYSEGFYTTSNFKIEKTVANVIKVHYKGATDVEIDTIGVTELVADTWYHLAIVRENGYFKIYVNGQLDATSLTADNHAISPIIDLTSGGTELTLGGFYYESPENLQGWMDEIRCSIGIARWTSNFSVPTIAYQTGEQTPPCDNMVLQSEGFETNQIATSARLIVVMEDDDNIIPNTDIKAYVSRDGGTTFTQADLVREFEVEPTRFYVGTFNLASQPNGKEMVYKITSHNNKNFKIRYLALNWC